MNNGKQNNNLLKELNSIPLEDFDGFTPNEMDAILYSPFSKDCPIRLRQKIESRFFDQCPIFRIVLHLLKTAEKKDGIKLTSRGYLPPALVTEIYDKRYHTDFMIENDITKLNQEAKWLILHCTKIALKPASLARPYKGKFLLTKKAKKFLSNEDYSTIFHLFLDAFSTRFNWAYNDFFQDENIGQVGCFYLLHLLNKYGSEYRDISFYTELYFKAFPNFKIIENDPYAVETDYVLKARFFERFAKWFGFVEVQGGEIRISNQTTVKRTKLLSHLIQ